MAYTLTIDLPLGSSQTGLTLKARVFDTAGVQVGGDITTGFFERGAGVYIWVGSIPDGHRGWVDFLTTGGTFKTALSINPEETNPLSVAVPAAYASGSAGAALGRIGSGQIITVAPVAQSGDVTIVHGDDYLIANARALEWTDASAAWPDLTGATIALAGRHSVTNAALSKAGTVVQATAPGKVRVELTAAETTALTLGVYRFDVQATISGKKITLVRGVLTVQVDYAA